MVGSWGLSRGRRAQDRRLKKVQERLVSGAGSKGETGVGSRGLSFGRSVQDRRLNRTYKQVA